MSKSPYDIILYPYMTEKSELLKEENKYCFVVRKDANKIEIKKAIEEIFDVTVLKVRTMNVRGKVKRRGRFFGKRPNWKKAIVTIQEDRDLFEI